MGARRGGRRRGECLLRLTSARVSGGHDFVREQHDLRDRECVGVRDGQKRPPRSHGIEAASRAAVKFEARWSAAADDFDAPPQHVLRMSGPQGFHRRFLRCEASGKMNGWFPTPHAIGDFAVRENALNETLAVAFDGRCNSRNVSGVDAEADDGGHDSMILPTPAPGFEWRQTPFGPALVCVPLEAIATHVFTSRMWEPELEAALAGSSGESASRGATLPDAEGRRDDSALSPIAAAPVVSEPTDIWSKAARAIALEPGELVRMKQVHGDGAVRAARETALERPHADIATCDDASLGVAVQAADCVPLLLADRRLGVVAAAHAGWRGLAQRVPIKTVRAMHTLFGSQPADLVAAVGPSVGACCYEVGEDVRRACELGALGLDDCTRWFAALPRVVPGNPSMPGLPETPRAGHSFFDGWLAVEDQLLAAGIPADSIYASGLCTASHADCFWSYRRDSSRAKRLVAAIRPRLSRSRSIG